jgi:hypothetical protein
VEKSDSTKRNPNCSVHTTHHVDHQITSDGLRLGINHGRVSGRRQQYRSFDPIRIWPIEHRPAVPVVAGVLTKPMHCNHEIDAADKNADNGKGDPNRWQGKRCVNQSQDTREHHCDANKPQQFIFGRFLHSGT